MNSHHGIWRQKYNHIHFLSWLVSDKNYSKLFAKDKKAITMKLSVLFSVQIIHTRTYHCHFNHLEQRICTD